MRYNNILLIILLFGSCYHTIGQRLQYPITLQRPTVDNYHGVEVMDEYQWLEDLNRPEVRIWIDDQNKVSEKYLKKLANQHNSVNLMNKYMLRKTRWDVYRNINFDNKRKSNYRLFYNDTYSTPSIYFKENNFNRYKILVDPQEISGKDRIDIESFEPSKDDKYLAYAYSRNGQDWREIKIKHTQGLNSPKETLSDIKFSSIRWMKDGFYYKKYPKSDITDKLGKPAIYFHKLFTEQSQDSLIFESKNPNDELYMYSNFEESMYLLEIANRAEHKFSYFYFDPSEAIKAFRPLFYKVDYTLSFVDYRKDHFIMRASIKGNQHLVSIPIDNPQKTALLTPVMPDAQLTGFELLDDRLVGTYQSLSKPHMIVLDLNGNLLKEIDLPDGISISGMNYQKATNEFIFYMESFTIPPVICKLDLETYEYEVIERTGVNFDFKDYKFKVEYALSTDSTEVPVFIVYKNELTKNSSTPFLIQAYGGYGVVSTPSYEPGIIYFIEQGGAFAFVHARGGGEKGNVWWQDGKRLNKQHCFDDVIASTEH
ncbi:MAG: prolyl oligopeptidase family serine peptidase, partial [Marinoscillum sp.]